MPPETCEYHTLLVADIAVIKTDVSYIKKYIDSQDIRITKHIDEGEKQGGFRDRVIILEQAVEALKKAMWIRVGVAGVIGGLVGSGSADAIALFLKWVMRGGG
jgi:hypothetical protein